MKTDIEAILFDVGGTLRYTARGSRAEKKKILAQIMEMAGAQEPAPEFSRRLVTRARHYKRWAEKTHIELSESDLWSQWMLPDLPESIIRERAIPLNQLYRAWLGQRLPFPESREVIIELFRRGYRLGVVSNTTSSVEVPELLRELQISGCFETVVLSAVSGTRKPSPAILLEAARRMGVSPEKCAYVGDRVDRDAAAARAAGFTMAVIVEPGKGNGQELVVHEAPTQSLIPDYICGSLRDLLNVFLPRPAPQPETVYDVSLSTMYAIRNFPGLSDFIEFARRAGFAHIELNHKVTSAMLEGIPLERSSIRSVHEPCPADIGEAELKEHDWLISSTDELCRVEGVRAIRRSIDLASLVGAKAIIIHAGEVLRDVRKLERQLRKMIDAGEQGSQEYGFIKEEMIALRKQAAAAGFESVKKSLVELLEYAAPHGICLGLENRYHYLEYPSPDEIEVLLGMAGPDEIGFIYDAGHAYTLDALGFTPHTEWLERFSARIIGTHLHDLRNTTDHFAPGLGTIDFRQIAAYLPKNAFRTCEIQTFNSPEQVKASLKLLAEQGCIQNISFR